MPEPSNTHAATPPKRCGLWQRVKPFPNLRKGGDGERKGERKHRQRDMQVEDDVPPVPDVPTVWAAETANPEEMMTFREILDSGGRWHPQGFKDQQ